VLPQWFIDDMMKRHVKVGSMVDMQAAARKKRDLPLVSIDLCDNKHNDCHS
jgi:hypothetical protein